MNAELSEPARAVADTGLRWRAVATDYDGTLATHGVVDAMTLTALEKFQKAGLRIILVTGRELEELRGSFPEVERFDLVVAENGGLLYWPREGRERLLAEPPPPAFIQLLKLANVQPLSVGRVIVATFEPHDHAVLDTIKQLGLEHQVIFNKGAIMVLPSGVNKASGLRAAARELGVEMETIVGIGDAENDHALLEACGCGVAVANALPALKNRADFVTEASHGAGVVELFEKILAGRLPVPSRQKASSALS